MNVISSLFQDQKKNKGNLKGQIILFMFRFAQLANRHILIAVLLCIYLAFYHVFIEWFLGIELPRKTRAGKGLVIYHGQALVVNQGVVFGDDCILRNSTTIGHKILKDGTFSACPKIGNRVDIGANVCIIGNVKIGNNVKIGAGAVVIKDIPDNCTVVGNPARII
ncbi:serine acetyltransferase [Pedobacter sp. SD-b]|uniref:Serine acetyltransferase n=1 Tax=Pedobacter segetis TaxID=2793069 RepID=A0ABS1BH90_9SPHI|nr:serine acetyltransferase [Pedobacter segetis]MBK0382252.1 serine acetyltransferase [Pedobacter segetis]